MSTINHKPQPPPQATPTAYCTIGASEHSRTRPRAVGQARREGTRLAVAHARPQDGEVLAYIATYLIPFLGLDLSKRDDVVVFCGFLLVLMVVYINSSMLFVNPLLSIAGYHSFDVEDPDGHSYTLIARRRDLEPGVALRPAQINRYIRLEVLRDRQEQSQ